MRNAPLTKIVWTLPLLGWVACTYPYKLPAAASGTSVLVVDGNIYASGDTTVIRLSRSTTLSDTVATFPAETGAAVALQSSSGTSYLFTEAGNGYYDLPPSNLAPGGSYRLSITLAGGKQYLSAFVPVVANPPIDSISWKQDPETGVTICANTHDPTGSARYFMWTYTEAYEYQAMFPSTLEYNWATRQIVARDTPVQTCYLTIPSSNVLIASAAALSQDVISMAPLEIIPPLSVKLSVEYSTLVTQVALTKDAYNYWLNMKNNSEDLGSIFGPQPFQVNGNIYSVSNPNEEVVGYVSATVPQQQRIFIFNSQLSNWFYMENCALDTLDDTAAHAWAIAGGPLIAPYGAGYLATSGDCGDCRFDGGILTKPPYWR